MFMCIFKGGGGHFCMASVKQLDDALGTVCKDGLTLVESSFWCLLPSLTAKASLTRTISFL